LSPFVSDSKSIGRQSGTKTVEKWLKIVEMCVKNNEKKREKILS